MLRWNLSATIGTKLIFSWPWLLFDANLPTFLGPFRTSGSDMSLLAPSSSVLVDPWTIPSSHATQNVLWQTPSPYLEVCFVPGANLHQSSVLTPGAYTTSKCYYFGSAGCTHFVWASIVASCIPSWSELPNEVNFNVSQCDEFFPLWGKDLRLIVIFGDKSCRALQEGTITSASRWMFRIHWLCLNETFTQWSR